MFVRRPSLLEMPALLIYWTRDWRALPLAHSGTLIKKCKKKHYVRAVRNHLLLHGRGVPRPRETALLDGGRELLGGVESREDKARLVRRCDLVHGRRALDGALSLSCRLEVALRGVAVLGTEARRVGGEGLADNAWREMADGF